MDYTIQLVDIGLTVVGTFVIGAALFYTTQTFRNTKKIDELSQTQNILDKLDNLDKELPDIDMDTEKGRDRLRVWEQRLFNTLEWLGYLVNNELIKDKKIHDYLKDDVIDWYEKGFLTSQNIDTKNPENYREFRKLYNRFKEENNKEYGQSPDAYLKKFRKKNGDSH